MSLTGFILDGAGGASAEREFAAYASFGPDGAGTHFEAGPAVHQGLPTCREEDLPADLSQAAAAIAKKARARQGRPAFFWARSILRPPRWYAGLSDTLAAQHGDAGVVVVDPYTFFGLIKLECEK